MYKELHKYYKTFIKDNVVQNINWIEGNNADWGGMIYAYLGNNIYIYDINSIENDCKFEVYKRIDNGEEIESIELFSFDSETDHISKLIDFVNKI